MILALMFEPAVEQQRRNKRTRQRIPLVPITHKAGVVSTHFQRIKVLLQNMMFQNRDNIRVWLAQAMQKVISGPANFQAAKVAILTLVSMDQGA